MIVFENSEEINFYLDRFFKVLGTKYILIKRQTNKEKTNILIVSSKGRRQDTVDVRIENATEEINPKRQKKS